MVGPPTASGACNWPKIRDRPTAAPAASGRRSSSATRMRRGLWPSTRPRGYLANRRRGKQVQSLIADAAKLRNPQCRTSRDLLNRPPLDRKVKAHSSPCARKNRIIDRRYQDLVKRIGAETTRHDLDNSEELIPYADVIVYR